MCWRRTRKPGSQVPRADAPASAPMRLGWSGAGSERRGRGEAAESRRSRRSAFDAVLLHLVVYRLETDLEHLCGLLLVTFYKVQRFLQELPLGFLQRLADADLHVRMSAGLRGRGLR